MLYFDIAKINYMMGRPEQDLTFDEIRNIDMLKMKILLKLKRSSGGMLRERALFAQQHQIRQFITNEPEQAKGGLLSGLGKMFGGKK